VSKKPIKPRKPEKKNRIEKKNRLNRLKFLKNRSVQFGFGFISKKPNRTETEKNQAKPSQNRAKPKNRAKTKKTGKTEPSWFEPVFSLKNRTEPKPVGLTRFRFGFSFFYIKQFGLVTFF